MYALLVGEAVGRAIEEQQREWAGVDGRKFRVGKRAKPLLGVVVADVESGGGSLRRLHSRRRGGGRQRLGTADGGGRRRSTLAAGVVVCRCLSSLSTRGGNYFVSHPLPCVLFLPPFFSPLPPSSSFVIHPPQKNAEPISIDQDF